MYCAEITGWGKCLPSAVLTNQDISSIIDTTDEWVRSRTGIGQRHISHVGTSDLGTVAAKKALAAAGITGADIDMIILASASPDTLIPNAASSIQENIDAQCPAFDINAACSGFLYALGLATAQIRTGHCKNILIVGAERLSFYLDWTLRESAILFGDGAGAVVLTHSESEQPSGVLNYALHNDPAGREILKVSGFGSSMDRLSPQAMEFFIQFEGKEIFKRAIAGMSRLGHQVLEENGLSKDDIDLIIPHQANIRIIDALVNKLGIPKEKAFINIENYGNTSAATIPIALCDALEEKRILPGSTLLSCAFGAGLTSAVALIKWGARVSPLGYSDASLPPCEKTALQMINRTIKNRKKSTVEA